MTFYTSWTRRLVARLTVAFIMSALGPLASIAIMFGVDALRGSSQSQDFISFLVFISSYFMILLLVLVAINRTEPSRLMLREQYFSAGGWFFEKNIEYNDISVIELDPPEHYVHLDRLQLIVRPRTGLTVRMWMTRDDAEMCFRALRTRCLYAPAIDEDKNIHPPAKEHYAGAARQVTARIFRRRARFGFLGAVYCSVVCIAIVIGITVAMHTSVPSSIGISIATVIATTFAVAATGSFMAFINYRKKAREASKLDVDSVDIEPIVNPIEPEEA